LTKLGSGTLTLSGANTFTGPISIMAGALAVTSESNLGSAGQVAVSGTGQLLFTTSATLTRTYDLGGASLVPAAASVLTLNGATVNGGLLAGSGIFALGPGAVLNNVTALTSSVFMQASGSATMNAGTFRGVLSQNGGTLALSNELVLGSGRLSLGGVVNATELESQGVVTIGNGGTLSATGSALYLTAGGRTTINSGGTLAAGSVTPIELNGSLLVNNGTQTGVLDVNFGSLAKGNGVFGSVNMNDGGRFSPGNSPGTATIGGDFALGAGSRYDFELNQANNTAGDGHADFLSINGVLSFDAGTTANSVFTLGLSTLNSSGVAAALPDFDASHPYTFTLASAAGGITGFAPEEVAIDSSGFRSNLEGGSFAVAQQGNSLILQFTPVPEPSTVAALLGGAVLWGLRRPRRRGVS
jgi:autotransporter-associated beta strand protein